MKHPKMDPLLIAVHEPHETAHVVAKLKKEGFRRIGVIHVHDAVKAVGHSRRKVYNHLRQRLKK